MNNKTGELLALHPLFDHNNCFDPEFMADPAGGICQLLPGKNLKEAYVPVELKKDNRQEYWNKIKALFDSQIKNRMN